MFDVPVDAMYVWIGVATVSVAVFGVATSLPSATPPDATAAARAIDTVAVGPPGSQGSHALRADRLRLGPLRIGLAGPGGRAHATFTYPITPVSEDSRLSEVLVGERPSSVFSSEAAFADAVTAARQPEHDWRPAPERLDVRRVAWGDVDVTLTG